MIQMILDMEELEKIANLVDMQPKYLNLVYSEFCVWFINFHHKIYSHFVCFKFQGRCNVDKHFWRNHLEMFSLMCAYINISIGPVCVLLDGG